MAYSIFGLGEVAAGVYRAANSCNSGWRRSTGIMYTLCNNTCRVWRGFGFGEVATGVTLASKELLEALCRQIFRFV